MPPPPEPSTPCEAVPFVEATPTLPVAHRLADTTDTPGVHASLAPTPPIVAALVPGFATLTACEGTTNALALALGPAPPTPETLLCVLCPWLGCFGALTGHMVYLGIYMAYALHVFVWRLCELVWLTHAPLGHALADDTRVVTAGDAWTLQLLVLLVLVRGWVVVCAWWVVRGWWGIRTIALISFDV